MNLADRMTLAYWVVRRENWLMNIQAPNSFAACNGFTTLLKELEPNGKNLPSSAAQAGATRGYDYRVATARKCV